MFRLYKVLVLGILFFSTSVFAQQYTISGVVTSAATGEKLIGANVFLQGTTMGAATDANGKYAIKVKKGTYTVVVSYVGFETKKATVNITNNMKLDFALKDYEFSLSLTVIADRARARETPVAFTNIKKKEMELQLGSRDIPLILNTTPSVYATQQGGGAGDARINIRGFNQRNVAIMINGVPVNDMENGWVYWSNWDGIGDVTSSIQVQRGLSAVNLATPSIGGTMNIITDPTAAKYGLRYKQEFGDNGFLKETLTGNTGVIDNKYAFSGTIVRKVGNGRIDKTWTDAWAYYFGASYSINSNNRLELFAIGAPQRHGQNLYKQNIAAYDKAYAKKLGYTVADLAAKKQSPAGRLYNENWAPVNPSYTGQQYWDGSIHSRYNPNFLNERENYYHKPIVNLNYYTKLSDRLSWYTTIYYSGGVGGGSGTDGRVVFDYSGPSRVVDWNKTIAKNQASTTGSSGILRNSVNTQWTIGTISKGYYKLSNDFTVSFGLDWRKARINHYREVRDLLGGKYYYFKYNQFDSPSEYEKHLGDKIDYYETNTVDWFGFYGQGEYTKQKFTLYGTYGWSTIQYSHTNHFKKDANGNELFLKSNHIYGFQLKGGLSYRISDVTDLYTNLGYVSKVPIFDNVIDDRTSTMANNPKNENFSSVEVGANFRALNGRLTTKLNYYYTLWDNQARSIGVVNQDGSSALIFLNGMNSLHTGFEASGAYQPSRYYRIDFAGSYGYWKYLDDVNGVYKSYSANTFQEKKYHYYVKGLMVGDAPQTQIALSLTVMPVRNMQIQGVFKNYSRYWAGWDPFSRTDATDKGQVWQLPNYGLFDLHFMYNLPFHFQKFQVRLFASVFNVFNTVYVQDATDESRYNAIKIPNEPKHTAARAEVFLGIPRTFNLGFRIQY